MIQITPAIGERMRDTARELAGIVHLDRFRATRAPRLDAEREAIREEYVMSAITRTARRLGSTIEQITLARGVALTALADNRSMAWAISVGKKQLPDQRMRAGAP